MRDPPACLSISISVNHRSVDYVYIQKHLSMWMLYRKKKEHLKLKTEHCDLKKEFNSLKELIAANMGVTPPLEVERSPIMLTNWCFSCFTGGISAWFQPVWSGVKPIRSSKQLLTPTTFNRFQVLWENLENEFETCQVRNSIVHWQLIEFSGCFSNSCRKYLCYPGARLDKIISICEDVTKEANANTFFIIHMGTNNVKAILFFFFFFFFNPLPVVPVGLMEALDGQPQPVSSVG